MTQSPGFKIHVFEEAELFLTTFSRFDDETLRAYAEAAAAHPQYNAVQCRILDIYDVEKPEVTFEETHKTFQKAGSKSKEKVEVILLAHPEHLEGVKRLTEVHADTAPFKPSDRAIVEERKQTSPASDIQARMRGHIEKAERALNQSAMSPLFKDVVEHLGNVDPGVAKVFSEIRKSYAEDNLFASTAGAYELLRRFSSTSTDSIHEGLIDLVKGGELTEFLQPTIEQHRAFLSRDAIGNDEAATVLLRLCTVFIIYKYILPNWVEQYVAELIPIEPKDRAEAS